MRAADAWRSAACSVWPSSAARNEIGQNEQEKNNETKMCLCYDDVRLPACLLL
jgi:hypothetical protein